MSDRFQSASQCEAGTCVEVAFVKSTRSGNNGACVEVGACTCGTVKVRDSKDPTGPVLEFNQAEWAAFLGGVRGGEFDF